ncbi:MAG: glycerol-3-phosphate 1-O-acyltransferase PlsY [Coriobacteriia bacterium]
MDGTLRIAASLVVAFACGSIPFAVIVSRLFFHTDIREHGSGNPGATNVLRILGPAAGGAVFVLDIAKGALGVALARLIIFGWSGDTRDWLLVGAAMAAIAGHSFSPFIGFKGGKGVATAAGAISVLMPGAFFVLLATFVLVVWVGRMVSLGSVVLACEIPVVMVLLYGDRTPLVLFGFATGALVFWRHRANIRRIFRGEEHKISFTTKWEVTP